MSYYPKPKKKFTKKDGQRIHAMRRAAERFDIRVEPEEIVKLIQRGQARFLLKESNRLHHFRVVYQGKEMDCVYDRKRKMIVTFLKRIERQDDNNSISA